MRSARSLLDGSTPVERTVHVRLDPAAGAPTGGAISLAFQSASGLSSSWTPDVTLTLHQGGAPVASTSGASTYALPVEQCKAGCDLEYQVVVTPVGSVVPGSVVRFEVDATLDYANSASWYGGDTSGLLVVDLQGATTAPPAVTWSVLAAVLAFVVGVLVAGRANRLLGPSRRAWPAMILLALVLLGLGRTILGQLGFLLEPGVLDGLFQQPLNLLWALDPWSIGILSALAFGLYRGIRRWPSDGGWSMALAAVATVGVGGLWLVFVATLVAVVHPIGLAVLFAVPAGLGGLVVGQAWRTDPSSPRDRVWVATAVVAHGIVISGLTFQAAESLASPFGDSLSGLVPLIGAVLIALAFFRWLQGQRAFLILFDLLIAGFALLILSLGLVLTRAFPASEYRIGAADVAIAIAASVALVALVTACHRVRGPAVSAAPPPSSAPPPPAPLVVGPPTM